MAYSRANFTFLCGGETLRIRDHLEDLDVDDRIILKGIVNNIEECGLD
jgi:hypothetical protein